MTEANTNATSPTPPRSWGKRVLRWLLALLLILLLALAVLLIWAGRETSLQSIMQTVAQRSGAQIEGVSGSLYGPLKIARISYKDREQAVLVQNIALDYAPWHLLRGHLALTQLQAEVLEYEALAPSPTPAKLPTSLELPISIALPQLQVQTVRYKQGTSKLALQDVTLGLDVDKQQWRLRQTALESEWGHIKAEATLASASPFKLQGRIEIAGNSSVQNAMLHLDLGGDLRQMQITGNAKQGNSSAKLALALKPFDEWPLQQIMLQAQGVNPSLLNAEWPQADLQVDINATIPAPASRAAVSGRLLIKNGKPGPVDQHLLPISSLQTELAGNWSQTRKPLLDLQFKQMLLDFGSAGQFSGDVEWRQNLLQGSLATRDINLQGLHSKMKPTHIAGKISAQQQKTGQTLQADLSQGDFKLVVDANLQPKELVLQNASLLAKGSSIKLQGKLALDGARLFSGKAEVAHFNPASWGKFASADVNLGLTLAGELAPEALQSTLKLDAHILPSQLWGQPLRGNANLQAAKAHVQRAQAKLEWGDNRLQLDGTLGQASDQLRWEIEAPQLAALQAGIKGKLSANGVAHGTLQTLASSFNLTLKDLQLAAGVATVATSTPSELQVHGDAQLHAPFALKLQGTSQNLNPATLAALPNANLNGDFSLQGQLGTDWHTDWQRGPWQIALNLQQSQWQQAALSASLSASLKQGTLAQLDAKLKVGENRVTAQGAFGLANQVLQVQWNAPQLAQFDASIHGLSQGEANLSADLPALLQGKFDSLALKLKGQGSAIKLAGVPALKKFDVLLDLPTGLDSALQLDMRMQGAQFGSFLLEQGKVQLTGSRRAHELSVSAKNEAFEAQTVLRGGLLQTANQVQWQGQIINASNSGNYPLQIKQAAPLQVTLSKPNLTLHSLLLSKLNVTLAGGNLEIEKIEKVGTHWQSRGQLSHLPLKFLLPQTGEDLHSDMLLAGNWDVDIGNQINGRVQLGRESGDLRTGLASNTVIGTRQLLAVLSAKQDALQLTFDFDSSVVGHAHLDATSRIARLGTGQGSKLGLVGSAPLALHANAQLQSLAFLAPLTGVPDAEFGGQLNLQVESEGTLAAPQLRGNLTAQQLALNWPSLGLKLKDGTLTAKLAQDQLQVQQFQIAGQQGNLTAQGYLRFAEQAMQMQIDVKANQLQLLGRPDRQLVLSGDTSLHLEKKLLAIKGKLRADSANIELALENGPTYSSDVVIVGAPPVKASSQAVTLDLDFDLGENFHLRGGGLKADLIGALRLQALDKRGPRAYGSIQVASGSYKAYGQNLQITVGKLNFSGVLDNPGLNITAVRKPLDPENGVEAGIELRGTLQAPQARLISKPAVPDSEKLMWLVLGHGTEGSADKDNPLLGLAVGALFGGVESNQFASTLALDEINLNRAAGLESTVLSVGKRLSSKAFLTLEQGASNASSLLKLRYTFNPRLSVQVQTGTNNAVDVFYTWRFD